MEMSKAGREEQDKRQATLLLVAALKHAHDKGHDEGFEKGAAAAIELANERLKEAGVEYELVAFVV